jgi:hypothetical protein
MPCLSNHRRSSRPRIADHFMPQSCRPDAGVSQ